jgi:hypothetical protein
MQKLIMEKQLEIPRRFYVVNIAVAVTLLWRIFPAYLHRSIFWVFLMFLSAASIYFYDKKYPRYFLLLTGAWGMVMAIVIFVGILFKTSPTLMLLGIPEVLANAYGIALMIFTIALVLFILIFSAYKLIRFKPLRE